MQKGFLIMTSNNEVPRYLERKFWEWQAGERRTQKEFADFLGVEPAALSHWMNGVRKPDYESCIHLSSKLGPEIYDYAGYIRPDPQLKALISRWDHLTPSAKRRILHDAGVEDAIEIPERSAADKNH